MDWLDDIPRPALWAAAVGVVAFIFLRRPAVQQADPFGPTMASMQLSAASNIEALSITSQRDVALAQVATERYAVAESMRTAREGQVLNAFSERSAGKVALSLDQNRHEETLKGLRYNYALARAEQKQLRTDATRMFGLAKKQQNIDYALVKTAQKSDFFLSKLVEGHIYTEQLRSLANQREANYLQYKTATGWQDLAFAQSWLQFGSDLVGAVAGAYTGGATSMFSSFGGMSGGGGGTSGPPAGGGLSPGTSLPLYG